MDVVIPFCCLSLSKMISDGSLAIPLDSALTEFLKPVNNTLETANKHVTIHPEAVRKTGSVCHRPRDARKDSNKNLKLPDMNKGHLSFLFSRDPTKNTLKVC
jgi:hypothetical protein